LQGYPCIHTPCRSGFYVIPLFVLEEAEVHFSAFPRTLPLIWVSAGLGVFAIGLWFWIDGHKAMTTDDAFISSDIITVASQAQGTITALSMTDNSYVERGTPILQIDSSDLKLALKAAQTSRYVADAQLDEVKAAGAAAALRRKSAEAAVRLADIRVAQAQLALDKAQVTAPVSGYVTHRMVAEGDSVHMGQPLLAIVAERSWITANLKETQLAGIKAGDLVDVRIDAFPDLQLNGHVESLQQGAGQSFSLLPPENASGNFVKVVQRVPVKIALDTRPDRPLPPGLSARVKIHVR
jgi:membrane fusion protein (multidrug efflux system)